MTTIYLVRHGQTAWTKSGRVQGWAPVSLNETGERQIRHTADRLSEELSDTDSVRLVTSDLQRASETASIIAAGLDGVADVSDVSEHEGLRERDFGVLQGLDDPEYRRVKGEMRDSADDRLSWTPERGESWRAVESRVTDAWESTVAEIAEDESRILVSHTGPMYCVLATVNERPLRAEMDATDLPEGSIFEIEVDDTESRVRSSWAPSDQ